MCIMFICNGQSQFYLCEICHNYLSVHTECLKSYSKASEEEVIAGIIPPQHNRKSNFVCTKCMLPCFLCGDTHTLRSKKPKIYKCTSCPSAKRTTCIIQHNPRTQRVGCVGKYDSYPKFKQYNQKCFGQFSCF